MEIKKLHSTKWLAETENGLVIAFHKTRPGKLVSDGNVYEILSNCGRNFFVYSNYGFDSHKPIGKAKNYKDAIEIAVKHYLGV